MDADAPRVETDPAVEAYKAGGEGCVFCTVLRGLENAEVYPRASGGVYRKVRDLPASVAILGHDQFYRGYTVVVARTHATELYHLGEAELTQYLADMVRVARALDQAFHPSKMNYECLGNSVAHLHWHLFPRYGDDPTPRRPVWAHAHQPPAVSDAETAATIAAIRRHLA